MLGSMWPPIERFKDQIEELLKDYWEGQQDKDSVAAHNQLASTLGQGLTPAEEAMIERAATIAREAKKEEVKVNTEAPAKAGVDDPPGTHCSASSSNADAQSPEAKRVKGMLPPDSPSNQNIPRSPVAISHVLESLSECDTVPMSSTDNTEDVMILEDVSAPAATPTDVTTSKAKVMHAAEVGGDAASLAVKVEEVEKHEKGYSAGVETSWPKTKEAGPSSASKALEVEEAKAAKDQDDAEKKEKKPARKLMSSVEMQQLYLTVRRRTLQWVPNSEDEEGMQSYMVAEVDNEDVVRLDSVVTKGTGKSCGASLGARYSSVHLRWVMVNEEGEEEYLTPIEEEEVIHTPDILWSSKHSTWMSFQLSSHDFVPSKNEMAQMLYSDSKLVKFAKPRHNAPWEWLPVDTVASAAKNVPVQLFDFDTWIKIGDDVEGPFPQEFKDYVKFHDQKLVDLQNKMLLHQDNFLYLREKHSAFFLPKPVHALQNWSNQNVDILIQLTSEWAAHDIVKNEEDAATKNNKKADKTVPAQVYDDVVKALPPLRKMAARLGSVIFKKEFELPVTPLNIERRESSQTKGKREREQGRTATSAAAASRSTRNVGRQPGAMKKTAPAAASRDTRSKAAPKAAPPPPPAPPPLPTKVKNTPANAAAGNVSGGQPVPENSHPVNPNLAHLQIPMPQHGSPHGSTSHGSTSSYPSNLSSAAYTELNTKIDTVLTKMSSTKADEDKDKELSMLRAESASLRKSLMQATSELAASQARLEEVRDKEANAKQACERMEAMCKNVLKTMENLQAPSKSKKDK